MAVQTDSVPSLLAEIVGHARSGDYGTASSLLNRSIPLMQAELTRGTTPPPVLAQVTSHLDGLLRAQQRGDWVGFADVLEFTFIDFWHDHFSAPC